MQPNTTLHVVPSANGGPLPQPAQTSTQQGGGWHFSASYSHQTDPVVRVVSVPTFSNDGQSRILVGTQPPLHQDGHVRCVVNNHGWNKQGFPK